VSTNLLLLEDEVNVGSTVKDRLQMEGFQVFWAQSLSEAKLILQNNSIALALLDVQLPDGSGFDLGRVIRQKHPEVVMVFLTAAGTTEDRIHGLELGAEDYIVKPFNFKELLLRIQNASKRLKFIENTAPQVGIIKIGRAAINFKQYEIVSDGQKYNLSHKECALLKLLYEKRGEVVSRDDILNVVWSENEYPTPRTIDNFVLKLRKWIEPDPNDPTIIRSVRGVGYLIERETS
jgi:two-component system alkaline phosphatase synthesis response regulator PhoP